MAGAAMASMTLQLRAVAPGAAALTRRNTCIRKQQLPCATTSSSSSSSSWVCRATPNGESKPRSTPGKPDKPRSPGDLATAVKENTTDVVEDVKETVSAVINEPLPQAGPPGVDNSDSSKANLQGAAAWYQEFGRSVPPEVDARDYYYGPDRPLWKGVFTNPSDVPDYLTGEFPGDYGCDIFKLVRLPKRFERLRAQELMNGRWAMLGIVGCLAPELISPQQMPGFEPVWFKAGAQIFSDSGIDYLGVPGFINAHSLFATVVVNALLMGVAEGARAKYVPEGVDPIYPGGKKFDPLGFATDPEIVAELRVKEIKNGRLAMMAMAGLFAQGYVTGVSPIQNFHEFFQI